MTDRVPNYVTILVTEAQHEVLRQLVRDKIATIGTEAEDFQDHVRLLGALAMPVKQRQLA